MTAKYVRILDLMKAKGGSIDVDDPELVALLKEGVADVNYRLPAYIYDIRDLAGLKVTSVRTGRKIKTYVLDALSIPTDTPSPDSTTVPTNVELPATQTDTPAS